MTNKQLIKFIRRFKKDEFTRLELENYLRLCKFKDIDKEHDFLFPDYIEQTNTPKYDKYTLADLLSDGDVFQFKDEAINLLRDHNKFETRYWITTAIAAIGAVTGIISLVLHIMP